MQDSDSCSFGPTSRSCEHWPSSCAAIS